LGRRARGSRLACGDDADMTLASDTDVDQPAADDDEDIEVDVEECSDSESMQQQQHEHRLGACKLLKPAASESGSEHGDEREGDSPDLSDEKAGAAAKVKVRCNCEELLQTECHLETKELWDKFHDLGTEMIITKTGR
jgi:T-box protein 20